MTGVPLITVITATYNSSASLALAVKSVLRQEVQDFEMLVVGDACTDDTEAVVRGFADERVRFTNLPTNSESQAGPNNEGLRQARGEYIAFLGHDDLWFPTHLSGLMAAQRAGAADLVHSLCPLIGPDGVFEMIGSRPRDWPESEHNVPPSCWLMTRAAAERAGPWPSPLEERAVDHVMLKRVRALGMRIECVSQLSMLKFPSVMWRPYAMGSERPQAAYSARMEANAASLALDVLLSFADLHSRNRPSKELVRLSPALRNLVTATLAVLRALLRAAADIYGRERAPLKGILARRRASLHARALRRTRALRGLTDSSPA